MSEPDLDASQGDNELTLSSYWSSQLDPNGLGSFPESKLHDVAAHVGIPSDGISGFIELFEKGEEGAFAYLLASAHILMWARQLVSHF